MGLAATQARYLGLTARKTNIEYEGQQVNQQRTALANQSSSLYQRLYSMSVPTPPSVTDYYKTEYTYSAGGTKYTVNSYTPSSSGTDTYDINVSYTGYVDVGLRAYATGNITKNNDGTYTIEMAGGAKTYTLDPAAAVQDAAVDEAAGRQNGYYCTYTDSDSNTKYFIDTEWLQQQTYPYNDTVQRYYKNTESKEITEDHRGCTLNFDSTGTISKIVDPSISETELSMSANEIQDTDAYQVAMNKYTKDKDTYEKELAEINAETADVQSQDRSLELRLRQLDTEQEALQTEMDSIKSVLDKNIEKVFKVFA